MHDPAFRGRCTAGAANLTARLALAALFLATGPAAAQAQSGWTAVEGKASILLPAPSAGPVSSASLDCSGQRWSLRLQVEDGAPVVSGPVSLGVDREQFSLTAKPDSNSVLMALPAAVVERIKSGIRLSIRLSLDGPDVDFSLRGSRRAIETAAPFCSPRDMSAFEQIALSAIERPDLELARTMRTDDIKAFRAATSSEPKLNAGVLTGEGESRIVFAQLCGSSWYFGRTGCNIAGYLIGTSGEDQPVVFDGEGAALYAVPDSGNGGWPDLIAVSPGVAGADIIWRWDGSRYSFLREDAIE